MPFEFEKTSIPDVVIIKPKVFGDDRGYFVETFKKSDFTAAGIPDREWVQDNESKSQKGVIRGLHFQKGEYAQAKLVRCVSGSILDVVVDVRKDSPTFGKHVAVELSEKNKWMLYVPRGFAHGFASLVDGSVIVYKNDNKYSPEHEGGIIWNDPLVGIKWPFENPILSERDKKWPMLSESVEKNE